MIFWVALLPKLKDLITRLAVEGTDPLWLEQGAEWSHDRHSMVASATAVQIDIKIAASAGGFYETRFTDYTDPDTGTRSKRAVFTGNRDFVMNVQCKAYSAEYETWALVYAERIRSGVQRAIPELQDELGVAFWKDSAILTIDGVEDGQATSICNLDLFGRVGFTDDPLTAPLVPLFTSVFVTSKLAGYVPGQAPNFAGQIPEPINP